MLLCFPTSCFGVRVSQTRAGVSRCSARSPLRPFPQFMSAGFTGFTLTPLTPALRPPTATHPLSTNQLSITSWSRACFPPIGPILLHLCFWLVTCYHPPDCSEFCFCFFFLPPFLIHSAEVGPCSKKVVRLMSPGSAQRLCRAFYFLTLLFTRCFDPHADLSLRPGKLVSFLIDKA